MPQPSEVELRLLEQYGGLLDSATTARLLGYPSADALTKARRRGHLTLPMMRIAHRRGWWATPKDVAKYLARLSLTGLVSKEKKGGRHVR
ncbi:hypothetical protein [Lysobacter sp.]|uniref:hypothetical protein n=1 Tax=Lysobacter sp. TaxID=72226 RepID=UPI002D5C7A7D|nr:hypothetical protein [Lysobacter sp.]HZX77388.1 hypothetical protein [Lysobacter sp.]